MTRIYGQPWNKGRNVGPRQALTPVNVRAVKKYLAQQKSPHDLCLFTVAVDTMLRASDLMRLRVSDISFANGNIRNNFRWRQKKTSNGVNPVLTDSTQKALKTWINTSNKHSSHFLFTREKPIDSDPITVGFYRNLVKDWVKAIGLGTLLATVGVSLASCNKSSSAEQQAQNPPAKEMILASADEAKDFATLPLQVRQKIRAEFDECMADVEDFARDGNENDPISYQEDFDEGADDCDGMRKSNIRIAVAEKGIEETTRSITSGS